MQNCSVIERLKRRPIEERIAFLAELEKDPARVTALRYSWEAWARPSQLLPSRVANPRTLDGDWTVWYLNMGRGSGKTRSGAETVRAWVKDFPFVNLVGATADDARDIMIEGESGILACCPPHERPLYQPSRRQLSWPNGAVSLIFTADEPERLRGKQHAKAWADEVASWRYAEAWDQLMFGLRLGACPQVVVTTTPRPTRLIKELLADPTTIVTHGTTYDNRSNLAPTFFSRIINKYEGTRLGRQELNAELLIDNPGALWNHSSIDATRIEAADLPMLVRVVVGVDPAVTSNDDSDSTGIVVVGMDGRVPEHYYVMEDATLKDSPQNWGLQAIKCFHRHKADRVVAEVNNGGDLVEALLRNIDENVSYGAVHATRGKVVRAEPVAALYEQGRVHHVGSFPPMEDEMCDYVPGLAGQKSPNRMDALVWAVTELTSGSGGWAAVIRDAITNKQKGAQHV